MAKVRMTDLSDLLGAKKARAIVPDPEAEPTLDGQLPASEETPLSRPKMSTLDTMNSVASRASTIDEVTPGASTSTSTGGADRGSRAPKAQTQTPTPDRGMPRYLTLMRKEARITATQADELSRLVRTLNRARCGQGERITDNTLIRVAIGLLMERVADLRGATEAELFQSLGLEPAE